MYQLQTNVMCSLYISQIFALSYDLIHSIFQGESYEPDLGVNEQWCTLNEKWGPLTQL